MSEKSKTHSFGFKYIRKLKNIVFIMCVTSPEFLGYSMVLLFLSDYSIESDLFLINF